MRKLFYFLFSPSIKLFPKFFIYYFFFIFAGLLIAANPYLAVKVYPDN